MDRIHPQEPLYYSGAGTHEQPLRPPAAMTPDRTPAIKKGKATPLAASKKNPTRSPASTKAPTASAASRSSVSPTSGGPHPAGATSMVQTSGMTQTTPPTHTDGPKVRLVKKKRKVAAPPSSASQLQHQQPPSVTTAAAAAASTPTPQPSTARLRENGGAAGSQGAGDTQQPPSAGRVPSSGRGATSGAGRGTRTGGRGAGPSSGAAGRAGRGGRGPSSTGATGRGPSRTGRGRTGGRGAAAAAAGRGPSVDGQPGPVMAKKKQVNDPAAVQKLEHTPPSTMAGPVPTTGMEVNMVRTDAESKPKQARSTPPTSEVLTQPARSKEPTSPSKSKVDVLEARKRALQQELEKEMIRAEIQRLEAELKQSQAMMATTIELMSLSNTTAPTMTPGTGSESLPELPPKDKTVNPTTTPELPHNIKNETPGVPMPVTTATPSPKTAARKRFGYSPQPRPGTGHYQQHQSRSTAALTTIPASPLKVTKESPTAPTKPTTIPFSPAIVTREEIGSTEQKHPAGATTESTQLVRTVAPLSDYRMKEPLGREITTDDQPAVVASYKPYRRRITGAYQDKTPNRLVDGAVASLKMASTTTTPRTTGVSTTPVRDSPAIANVEPPNTVAATVVVSPTSPILYPRQTTPPGTTAKRWASHRADDLPDDRPEPLPAPTETSAHDGQVSPGVVSEARGPVADPDHSSYVDITKTVPASSEAGGYKPYRRRVVGSKDPTNVGKMAALLSKKLSLDKTTVSAGNNPMRPSLAKPTQLNALGDAEQAGVDHDDSTQVSQTAETPGAPDESTKMADSLGPVKVPQRKVVPPVTPALSQLTPTYQKRIIAGNDKEDFARIASLFSMKRVARDQAADESALLLDETAGEETSLPARSGGTATSRPDDTSQTKTQLTTATYESSPTTPSAEPDVDAFNTTQRDRESQRSATSGFETKSKRETGAAPGKHSQSKPSTIVAIAKEWAAVEADRSLGWESPGAGGAYVPGTGEAPTASGFLIGVKSEASDCVEPQVGSYDSEHERQEGDLAAQPDNDAAETVNSLSLSEEKDAITVPFSSSPDLVASSGVDSVVESQLKSLALSAQQHVEDSGGPIEGSLDTSGTAANVSAWNLESTDDDNREAVNTVDVAWPVRPTKRGGSLVGDHSGSECIAEDLSEPVGSDDSLAMPVQETSGIRAMEGGLITTEGSDKPFPTENGLELAVPEATVASLTFDLIDGEHKGMDSSVSLEHSTHGVAEGATIGVSDSTSVLFPVETYQQRAVQESSGIKAWDDGVTMAQEDSIPQETEISKEKRVTESSEGSLADDASRTEGGMADFAMTGGSSFHEQSDYEHVNEAAPHFTAEPNASDQNLVKTSKIIPSEFVLEEKTEYFESESNQEVLATKTSEVTTFSDDDSRNEEQTVYSESESNREVLATETSEMKTFSDDDSRDEEETDYLESESNQEVLASQASAASRVLDDDHEQEESMAESAVSSPPSFSFGSSFCEDSGLDGESNATLYVSAKVNESKKELVAGDQESSRISLFTLIKAEEKTESLASETNKVVPPLETTDVSQASDEDSGTEEDIADFAVSLRPSMTRGSSFREDSGLEGDSTATSHVSADVSEEELVAQFQESSGTSPWDVNWVKPAQTTENSASENDQVVQGLEARDYGTEEDIADFAASLRPSMTRGSSFREDSGLEGDTTASSHVSAEADVIEEELEAQFYQESSGTSPWDVNLVKPEKTAEHSASESDQAVQGFEARDYGTEEDIADFAASLRPSMTRGSSFREDSGLEGDSKATSPLSVEADASEEELVTQFQESSGTSPWDVNLVKPAKTTEHYASESDQVVQGVEARDYGTEEDIADFAVSLRPSMTRGSSFREDSGLEGDSTATSHVSADADVSEEELVAQYQESSGTSPWDSNLVTPAKTTEHSASESDQVVQGVEARDYGTEEDIADFAASLRPSMTRGSSFREDSGLESESKATSHVSAEADVSEELVVQDQESSRISVLDVNLKKSEEKTEYLTSESDSPMSKASHDDYGTEEDIADFAMSLRPSMTRGSSFREDSGLEGESKTTSHVSAKADGSDENQESSGISVKDLNLIEPHEKTEYSAGEIDHVVPAIDAGEVSQVLDEDYGSEEDITDFAISLRPSMPRGSSFREQSGLEHEREGASNLDSEVNASIKEKADYFPGAGDQGVPIPKTTEVTHLADDFGTVRIGRNVQLEQVNAYMRSSASPVVIEPTSEAKLNSQIKSVPTATEMPSLNSSYDVNIATAVLAYLRHQKLDKTATKFQREWQELYGSLHGITVVMGTLRWEPLLTNGSDDASSDESDGEFPMNSPSDQFPDVAVEPMEQEEEQTLQNLRSQAKTEFDDDNVVSSFDSEESSESQAKELKKVFAASISIPANYEPGDALQKPASQTQNMVPSRPKTHDDDNDDDDDDDHVCDSENGSEESSESQKEQKQADAAAVSTPGTHEDSSDEDGDDTKGDQSEVASTTDSQKDQKEAGAAAVSTPAMHEDSSDEDDDVDSGDTSEEESDDDRTPRVSRSMDSDKNQNKQEKGRKETSSDEEDSEESGEESDSDEGEKGAKEISSDEEDSESDSDGEENSDESASKTDRKVRPALRRSLSGDDQSGERDSKRQSLQRSVSFDDVVATKEFPRYDASDKSDLFYDKVDIESFKFNESQRKQRKANKALNSTIGAATAKMPSIFDFIK